jgi:hypothetical protein
MGERIREPANNEHLDDVFEPMLDDLADDEFEELTPLASSKKRLAEKRRKAELRLEEKRLRDELGFYDLEFDDI